MSAVGVPMNHDYTTWNGLRAYVAGLDRMDIDKMDVRVLIALSEQVNRVIQAQFLPPVFTFAKLCRIYDRIHDRIMGVTTQK